MRKAITRGKINVTFLKVTGKAKIFDRTERKDKRIKIETYVRTSKGCDLQTALAKTFPPDQILLEILDTKTEEVKFTMDEETFINNATIY